jgi:hypothetical protein
MTVFICWTECAGRHSVAGNDLGDEEGEDMTVDRTQVGYQTSYTLRDVAGPSCTLTCGAGETAPAEWKIQLPGGASSNRVYIMHRFAAPVAARLRAWLVPIIGSDRAAELADAVGARPPRPPGRQLYAAAAAGLSIPRQRNHRAA